MKIDDYKRIRFENGKTRFYHDCIQVSPKVIFVLRGESWAVLDYDGNRVSSFKYLRPIFAEGRENCDVDDSELLITVQDTRGRYGAINGCGREAVGCRYDSCQIVDHHHAIVSIKTVRDGVKMGVVNSRGKEIIPLRYNDIVHAGSGGFLAKTGKLWGMLSFNGKVIIPFKYAKLSIATIDANYFGIVFGSSEYHFLDKDGKIIKSGKF